MAAPFVLACTPSAPGTRASTLAVSSDDPLPPHSLALACTGTDTIFANGFD